jgi:hypothetical protein
MSENRWEGIDEFVAVAECSQFTAAAERLGFLPPTSVDKSYAWKSACKPACSTAAPAG